MPVQNKYDVGIIGSGLGGMATACRLARQGLKVIVYEKNHSYGGKAGNLRLDFEDPSNKNSWAIFDTGPSLMTMPFVYESLFKDCGYNLKDYLEYKKLSEYCRYFWQDGQRAVMTEKGLDNLFGVEKKVVDAYLERAKRVYELTKEVFLENEFNWQILLKPKFWQAFINFGVLSPLQTLHNFNQKELQEEHLIQIFDRYATFNGSSPFKTPATMRLISYIENSQEPNLGVFNPRNGIRDIPKAIYELALELGVVFAFNTEVEKIVEIQSKVAGVVVEDNFLEHQIVVSNQDYYSTQEKLLGRDLKNKGKLLQNLSSSVVVFYWAVKTDQQIFGLHNTIFSQNYKQEFEDIFSLKSIPDDPTIYLNIACLESPQMCSQGYQNWFVVINVGIKKDYTQSQLQIQNLRKNVLSKLSAVVGFKVEEKIVAQKIFTPLDLQNFTFSPFGSLYGLSSNSLFSAFLRPKLQDEKIRNLFYVGGSVHPGGGMPLAVLGAKMVADKIIKNGIGKVKQGKLKF
jgi:phytoene desaturase